MFQRDLELPWRERFPTPNREHSKHVYENRGVPSRRLRLLLPPTQPRLPRHTKDGEQPKKGQAQARGSQHPKIRSPAPPQQGRGDKLRGAGKGAIQSTAAEKRGRCGRGTRPTPPAPRAPLTLGVRLASAGRREKKNKQNKTKKLKHNRNKPNPRGMQRDNPKLEGPPGRRVEELGLQRDQQLSGHSSLHVTLQF